MAEIVTTPLAPRQEGEVLVRALYSGISRGTEGLVYRGEVPPSQYEAMRAPFQEGRFPAPVKYGYASVGEVLDGPSDLVGRVVFCLHPHQDLYCVPAAAVTTTAVTGAVTGTPDEVLVGSDWGDSVSVMTAPSSDGCGVRPGCDTPPAPIGSL